MRTLKRLALAAAVSAGVIAASTESALAGLGVNHTLPVR